jgi:hypothetical protein
VYDEVLRCWNGNNSIDGKTTFNCKVVFCKIVAGGLLFLGVSLVWLGISGITGERLVRAPYKALGFGLALCFLGLVILLLERDGKVLVAVRKWLKRRDRA